MKLFKKQTRFEFLADRIYSNMQRNKFDLAYSYYNKFEKSWHLLNPDKKEKLKEKYDVVKSLLMLHMESSDLDKYGKDLSTEEVEERLEVIEDLMNSIKYIPKSFKNIINNHYKKSKRLYGYRVSKLEFDKTMNDVEALIGERNFDFALEKVKVLDMLERKMRFYSGNNDGRTKRLINSIRENLEFSYNESLAEAEPATYEMINEKSMVTKPLPILPHKEETRDPRELEIEDLKRRIEELS